MNIQHIMLLISFNNRLTDKVFMEIDCEAELAMAILYLNHNMLCVVLEFSSPLRHDDKGTCAESRSSPQ